MKDVIESCTLNAKTLLEGKTIRKVRYMTDEELSHMSWRKKSVVLHMSDGSLAFISMDDEGNDGGSMFVVTKGNEMKTICTI